MTFGSLLAYESDFGVTSASLLACEGDFGVILWSLLAFEGGFGGTLGLLWEHLRYMGVPLGSF